MGRLAIQATVETTDAAALMNCTTGASSIGCVGTGRGSSSMSEFEQAVTAHEAWRHAFEQAVRNGGDDLRVEVVAMDRLCPLHEWLVRGGKQAVSNPTASGMLREIHMEFHLAAAKVLALALAGRVQEAVAAMDQDGQYGRWSALLGPALRRYTEIANKFGTPLQALACERSA